MFLFDRKPLARRRWMCEPYCDPCSAGVLFVDCCISLHLACPCSIAIPLYMPSEPRNLTMVLRGGTLSQFQLLLHSRADQRQSCKDAFARAQPAGGTRYVWLDLRFAAPAETGLGPHAEHVEPIIDYTIDFIRSPPSIVCGHVTSTGD